MADQESTQPVVVERERKSYAGVIAAVVAIIVLVLLALYGLPYLTGGNNSTTNVDVNPTPTSTTGE